MKNQLLMGDCLAEMARIEDHSVDMILTDLPYGTTQCAWDEIIPFEPLWEQYKRVIKAHGAIVLFATEPFASKLRMSNLEGYKYDWIWNKVKGTGFLNANKQPMRNHELICVFYNGQCTYNPQKTYGHNKKISFRRKESQAEVYEKLTKDNSYESTERFPRSIQEFSTDTQQSSLHPTQKPIALCEYLIRTYTNKGETVLDSCMGSGTTCVAAHNMCRNYIGIEQEKKYYEIAVDRVKAAESQMNFFEKII